MLYCSHPSIDICQLQSWFSESMPLVSVVFLLGCFSVDSPFVGTAQSARVTTHHLNTKYSIFMRLMGVEGGNSTVSKIIISHLLDCPKQTGMAFNRIDLYLII